MRTATIVAKGPSALNAEKFIQPGDDIAVINDAAKLLPNVNIKYCFFAHSSAYPNLEHLKGRVEFAVSRKLNDLDLSKMPSWLRERHRQFDTFDCDGDYESLTRKMLSGGVMMHHTTTAAIHWLCKFGKYEKIRIIGVDGGAAYALGLERTPSLPNDNDLFRSISKKVADICTKVYGTDIQWYEL